MFIQDNYYYTCEVEDGQEDTEMTDSEKNEEFVPMFLTLEEAININATAPRINEMYDAMIERELRVLKLIAEQRNKEN